MIQVKIFVETGNHRELEEKINKWFFDQSQGNYIKSVKDIKFNDIPASPGYEAAYSAMVIYEI